MITKGLAFFVTPPDTKRRVLIVETTGGFCGYLACLGGLAAGAHATYIYEEKFTKEDVKKDAERLKELVTKGQAERQLILTAERIHFPTSDIVKTYAAVGSGLWKVHHNVLGFLQRGGRPSPGRPPS